MKRCHRRVKSNTILKRTRRVYAYCFGRDNSAYSPIWDMIQEGAEYVAVVTREYRGRRASL